MERWETYASPQANISILRGRIAEKLGLKTRTKPTKVTTFDSQVHSDRKFTDLTIESMDGTCSIDVRDVLVGDILTTEEDRLPTNEDITKYDYMKDQVSVVE